MAGLQASGDRQARITCCLGSMPWAAGAAQMAACVIGALCSALLPTYLALDCKKRWLSATARAATLLGDTIRLHSAACLRGRRSKHDRGISKKCNEISLCHSITSLARA